MAAPSNAGGPGAPPPPPPARRGAPSAPPLVRPGAEVLSAEPRAKYHEAQRRGDRARFRGLTFWSPNINIFRDPRWGRGQETYGEDPYLTGRLGVAFVRGLQGDDPKYLKTVSTPKHYRSEERRVGKECR